LACRAEGLRPSPKLHADRAALNDARPHRRLAAPVTLHSRSAFSLAIPSHDTHAAQVVQYTRLDDSVMQPGRDDPLTFYFIGTYGEHGPEVLHLQRGIVDGEEALVAHKVTGACHC
jgi:hypothetical protein